MKAIVNANIKNAIIVAIISNNEKCPGLLWAKQKGFNTIALDHTQFTSRESYDLALMQSIDHFQPDLIVLAGFMRILGQQFCHHYATKLINIHPSLLPAMPGLNTHQNAIDAGCKITGCTVHFVTQDLDNGPIIAQAAVAISAQDTVETLAQKVLALEHVIYPIAIQDFVFNHLSIQDKRVINQRVDCDYDSQKIIAF